VAGALRAFFCLRIGALGPRCRGGFEPFSRHLRPSIFWALLTLGNREIKAATQHRGASHAYSLGGAGPTWEGCHPGWTTLSSYSYIHVFCLTHTVGSSVATMTAVAAGASGPSRHYWGLQPQAWFAKTCKQRKGHKGMYASSVVMYLCQHSFCIVMERA